MKLSVYAKKLGVCYRTAWNMYQKGQIPGAYQLPSSTIIVPDSIYKESKEKQELMDDFIVKINEYCLRIYGKIDGELVSNKITQLIMEK